MPLRDWLIQFVAEQSEQNAEIHASTVSDGEAADAFRPSAALAQDMEWSSAFDVDDDLELQMLEGDDPTGTVEPEAPPAEAPIADALIDTAPIEPTIEVAPEPSADAGPDLEALVRALRDIAEQVQAANVWTPGHERPAAVVESAWAPAQGAADAMARLGTDLGRLIEVVDCGYERIEAMGALRDAELRAEIAQFAGAPSVAADDAMPPLAVVDPEDAAALAIEPYAHPPAADPLVPATFGRAAARFFDDDEEDPPVAHSDSHSDAWSGQAAEEHDLDLAAAEATPEAPLGALDPERDEWLFADADAPTTPERPPSEPLELTSTPRPRNAVFPWLGRRQGGLRKSA
jgi:hypothetical protein